MCKVWSAGVQASPLGKMLADQSDGTEVDRAGRVVVEPDLTIKGYPQRLRGRRPDVGAGRSRPGAGRHPGREVRDEAHPGQRSRARDPEQRPPFKYFDKGSMATVSRFSAVAQVGKLEFGGFIAWVAWLALHLYYLVGYRSRIMTVISWAVTFLGRGRGQMASTQQWVSARLALEQIEREKHEKLARGEALDTPATAQLNPAAAAVPKQQAG